jgi:hypothetical protein
VVAEKVLLFAAEVTAMGTPVEGLDELTVSTQAVAPEMSPLLHAVIRRLAAVSSGHAICHLTFRTFWPHPARSATLHSTP